MPSTSPGSTENERHLIATVVEDCCLDICGCDGSVVDEG
jgi:hypothetical protein